MFWEVFYAILLLLTGIGVFLVGIIKFSNVLQSSNNDRIKKYFEKLGNNRAKGFALGAGATTIIQSSTATTVITVGLVNAGIITFAQSTAVVFGANVGTALSNMLISLSAFRIKYFFMVLVFVGAFSKILVAKPKVHKVADVLIAFGIIFVGLEIMSIAFRNNDALVDLFSKLFNTVQFPLLLVLIGFILAAIMNSSTAATALLITFAANGALTFISIMFLFIGIKLGTTLTTLIASIPASRCAKRVAVMHLLFNVFGALIFLPIIWSLQNQISSAFTTAIPSAVWQISVFGLVYAFTTAIILLFFIKPMNKLAYKIVPEKPEQITIAEHIEDFHGFTKDF